MTYLKIIYSILLILVLSGCESGSGGGSQANLTPINESRLIFFGDEITVGTGVSETYVDLVSQSLGKEAVNKGYESNNSPAALMNNTVGTGNSSWSVQNLTANDVVIIFVGYQDVRYYGDFPSGHLNQHLGGFLDVMESIGCTVYVVTPILMIGTEWTLNNPYDGGSDAEMLEARNEIISLVSQYPTMNIIDAYSSYTPTWANTQVDGQFPNELGHQELANIILNGM